MVALPKFGLQGVFEDKSLSKGLNAAIKKINEASAKTKEAAKNASPLSQALDKMGFSVDKVKDKISQLTGINREAVGSIVDIAQALGPMAVAIGAAVVGAVALGAAFLALGNRGAALIPLAESFDNLTASVGISSQALLVDLRKAANGTVSDFDLIRRANLALVGTSGEFGKAFGKALPSVLASARAAAKATGQDVDFLFQSLVSGIKRASPRLIDNTGIVLKLSEANETLAKQLGKSVDQLTLEEKQIAILNATVAAGENLVASLGDQVESNSEKLARSQATITNTLDTLAVAMQPAFGTVLDIVNRVLGAFQNLVTLLAPILGAIASIITDVLGGAVNAIFDIIAPIVNAISSFLPYISILFQGIANIIHGAVTFIGNIIRGVVNFLKDVAKKFFGLDFDNLGKGLFEGVAAAFGSFANAIIMTANQLIFPAIIGIAQFIADFLIGFSPPKKGPLSMIDKGGENLMLAYLDGIAGVSLDPVEQVAQQVSDALGAIGTASLPIVNARLAELDKALLPFQQRLDIVKSQFDAIAAPAQAALDAIDRQLAAANEALAQGDIGAADTIRRLDAAREAIQGQLDAQQAIVDQQQIQLGLASASQAQERTLLNIRKAILEATKKTSSAAETVAGKVAKEPKGAGGAAPTPEEVAAGGGAFVAPGETVLDLISGQDAVNEAIAGIQDAFAGQIDTSQLALFQENQGALADQFARIGSVDIGAKLKDKFKGLTDLFDSNVEGSPANLVSKFFNPDPSVPGSLSSFVNSIGPTLDGLKNDVQAKAEDFFDSIFNPDRADSPANIVQNLFAGAETEGSIAYYFNNLGPNIEAAAPAIQESLSKTFSDMFDPEVEGSVAKTVTDLVMQLTGDEATANSVASFFSQLPENVSNAASGLFENLKTSVLDPVSNYLTGEGDGTLSGVLDTAVQFFADLPASIVTALQGFGATVYSTVAVPVINAINKMIELVETGIKGFLDGVATFVYNIADGLGLGGLVDTSGIRNVANDIKAKSGTINFGRISTELPAFLTPEVQGAARGGLFGPGALDVGERGKERIFAASKIGVLPAQLTKALDGLGSILAAPAPMMVPGGDVYNSSSSSFTFNGVRSDNDARRRYNALRAGMR
jgi:phage-related protein